MTTLACSSARDLPEPLAREEVARPRLPEMLETTAKRVTIERPSRSPDEVEHRAGLLVEAVWASERQQQWVAADAVGPQLPRTAGHLEFEYDPASDRLVARNREAASTLPRGKVGERPEMSKDEARAVAVETLARVRGAGLLDESWSDAPTRVDPEIVASGHDGKHLSWVYAFRFEAYLYGVPVLDSSFEVDVLANGAVESVGLAAMTSRIDGDAPLVLSASEARAMFVREARRTSGDPLRTNVQLLDEQAGYILPPGQDSARVCPSLVAIYMFEEHRPVRSNRAAFRPSRGALSLCDARPAFSVLW